MIYVGIDPGHKGAIVAADDNRNILFAERMPIKNNRIDLREFADLIDIILATDDPVVALEKPFVLRMESSVSAFTSGVNWGLLSGTLFAAGIEHLSPAPRKWRAALGLKSHKNKEDRKSASIEMATKFYPNLDLYPGRCTTPQDGLADAALLSEYARRMHMETRST